MNDMEDLLQRQNEKVIKKVDELEKEFYTVKISIDDSSEFLKITADAQDVGSGSESIGAILEGDGIQIAFNVRYILDGLKAIDSDQIKLCCNAPTTPAVLLPLDSNIGFTYLVMPVQIRSEN